ncbi:YybH family protein [Agrobacterium sp. NPDC090283]|uniref:YybH family protein n=1 Tax=Agrobacterium sp. NPDC090283 TaxID=3363920 RepID=UPI00383AA4D3
MGNDVDVQIRAVMTDAALAVQRGDVEGLAAMFHDDPSVILMDFLGDCLIDVARLRANAAESFERTIGHATCEYEHISVTQLSATSAMTWAIMRYAVEMRGTEPVDMQMRVTDVWSLIDGKWRVVHEHASFPVDPATGEPDMKSWDRHNRK